MKETLTVECPECGVVLIVDKKSGKVLETRKPIIEESSGDRFEDARRKVLDSSKRAEQLFEQAKKRESEKMDKLNAFFKEKQEELKDQPIERPEHPLDWN